MQFLLRIHSYCANIYNRFTEHEQQVTPFNFLHTFNTNGGAPLVPPPSSANQCVDEYERNLSPLQYMKMELNTHPLYNYSQKERNIQRHQNFSLEPACSSYPSGYYTGQQHVSALISQPLCLRNQSNNNSRRWGREQLSATATATGGCRRSFNRHMKYTVTANLPIRFHWFNRRCFLIDPLLLRKAINRDKNKAFR